MLDKGSKCCALGLPDVHIRTSHAPILFVLIVLNFFVHFCTTFSLTNTQGTALFLSQARIITEAPNADPNLSKRELLSLFRSVDPQMLMDEEEYELFRSLDDVVTIYRGVTSYNAQNVKALSWTLNRDTAEWFAHRFGEQGTVYEAQIPKEHICSIFLGRNEAEVIVDPKHLQNIAPAQEQSEAFEQSM